MAAQRHFMVTGPGVEKKCPDGRGPALSAAITFASRASLRREEATFYVRDPKGDSIGYATVEEDGTVTIRMTDRSARG